MKAFFVCSIVLFGFSGCSNIDEQHNGKTDDKDITPRLINFTILKELPHDTSSYTEGFLRLGYNGDKYFAYLSGKSEVFQTSLIKSDINVNRYTAQMCVGMRFGDFKKK